MGWDGALLIDKVRGNNTMRALFCVFFSFCLSFLFNNFFFQWSVLRDGRANSGHLFYKGKGRKDEMTWCLCVCCCVWMNWYEKPRPSLLFLLEYDRNCCSCPVTITIWSSFGTTCIWATVGVQAATKATRQLLWVSLVNALWTNMNCIEAPERNKKKKGLCMNGRD